MNDWINSFYFFIIGAALLLSVLGLWFTAILPGIDHWSRRFFRNYFIILFAACLFGLIEMSFLFYSPPRAAVYLVMFLESMLQSLPLPMLTVYLLHCCGESIRESRLLHAAAGLYAVCLVLFAGSMFFDDFYLITQDMQYHRGPLYPIITLPMIAIILLNLAGVLRRRNRLSHKTFVSFLVAILPITVTLLIHLFVDVFPLIDISIVLSILAMFGLVVSDKIELDMRRQQELLRQQQEIANQQLEIANQRANIMVLQMRPHFIYNTMTSIYCLCSQDPEKAQQVVRDFTDYLRKNFNAIASEAPIPFTSELEHTRAYLAVEQVQYPTSLFVEYDTPHTFFRVPPLTLQPIVENCVKHGRDPYAGPLRIAIRTRKTAIGSEVTVSDNGPGFHPADDDAPHIALNNIRQRLEIMCGGSLTIMPGDGRGTVVTVTIPDNAKKDQGD